MKGLTNSCFGSQTKLEFLNFKLACFFIKLKANSLMLFKIYCLSVAEGFNLSKCRYKLGNEALPNGTRAIHFLWTNHKNYICIILSRSLLYKKAKNEKHCTVLNF